MIYHAALKYSVSVSIFMIYIATSNSTPVELEVKKTKMFGIANVTVILEWIQEEYVYYNVSVVPPATSMFTRNTSFHLTVSYNTLYNVSVVAKSFCGHDSVTTDIVLNCGEWQIDIYPQQFDFMYIPAATCEFLTTEVLDSSLRVEYLDSSNPAAEGNSITFQCSSGELTGPNKTTCMESGQWEPDPREVKCKGMVNYCKLHCGV